MAPADSRLEGIRLGCIRRVRGLRAGEVARRAQLSRFYVSEIESGRANPSADALARLSRAVLEVSGVI
jgi:transcriptional regulator with XRE-family HTH domain